MNKLFFLLFILYFPFLIYAEDNNKCDNYDIKITELLDNHSIDDIYSFLNRSYYSYFKSCGNTESLKSITNKYIEKLGNGEEHNVSIVAHWTLLITLRMTVPDEVYFNFSKKYRLNKIKAAFNEYFNDNIYIARQDAVDAYTDTLKSEVDENFIKYYNVDSSKYCGIDGEGFAICTYKYIYDKPLKITGTLTVSNIYNTDDTSEPNYFKTTFIPDNIDLKFTNLFIIPVSYKLNTNIPNNYLQKGIAGEITFNVDFILDNESIMEKGKSTVGDIFTIYVKDLNINSVKKIKYYDKSFITNYKFNEYYDVIKTFDLKSDDEYINIREKPNGKVIYRIKINDNNIDNNIVYFYEGYKEPGVVGYILGYGYPPKKYLYNWFKILNFSKPVDKDWYFITYFPDNNADSNKAVYGYIHSSQFINENNNEEYNNIINKVISNTDLNNITNLSYEEVYRILYNITGEDITINRIPYIKNDTLFQLVNRYISFLLSDDYYIRDDKDIFIIDSLYYYIDDNIYYKILDKYEKDIVRYNRDYNIKKEQFCNQYIIKNISSKTASYFKPVLKHCSFDAPLDNITNVSIDNYQVNSAAYIFSSNIPVKISGKVTFDNTHNIYGHYFYFTADDVSLNLNNIEVNPLNYQINSNVYSNLISDGLLGRVTFNVELTLSKNSLFLMNMSSCYYRVLYVDNMLIKSAENDKYYNKEVYDKILNETSGFLKEDSDLPVLVRMYKISSKEDGSANLRAVPDGSIIKNIPNGKKVYFTQYYTSSLWNDIINYKYNKPYDWYRVLYFEDDEKDIKKAYIGYIHSSQLKKIEKKI